MITLHRQELVDALGVAGVGHRVRQLAMRLSFDDIEATRLGFAAREVAARLGRGASVSLGIEHQPGPACLCVAFESDDAVGLDRLASRFYERVVRDGRRLKLASPLPDDGFEPDDQWLEQTRWWLSQQTASELRAELNRRNEELQSALSRLDERARQEQRKSRELETANQELERLREREYKLARIDSLTGLPTRILFYDRLDQAIRLARRRGTHLAVLFVDLDYFKQLNDTYGHASGDAALSEVAQRMAGKIRTSDTIARLGGDEFAAIIQDIRGDEDARLVARKIVSAVSEPLVLDEGEHRLGASIGIALFPDHGDSAEALLKQADEAMYLVKRHGRNGIEVATA